MRRVAEFRNETETETEAERPEPAEHRRTLPNEEAGEACATLAGPCEPAMTPVTAYQAVAEELADVLYVTYGAAEALGIDLPAVLVEVHRSYMSKRDADGRPAPSRRQGAQGPRIPATDRRPATGE